MRMLGLRARLVLLVLVALAPMFALVAWETLRKQDEALDVTRERLLSQAQLALAGQERLMDRTRNLLEAVGNAPAIREVSAPDCIRYFAGLLTQYPIYNNLGLVSGLGEGELVCSASDARRPLPAASRVLLDRLLASRRFMMGEYERGQRSGREQVMFGAPVGEAASGVVDHAVYAALRLEAVAAALATVEGVEGASTLVMDRAGTVLAAAPPRPEMVGKRVPDEVVLRTLALPAAGASALATDAQAETREWAFARLADDAGTHLLVAVNAPRALILAPARADFAWQLGVLLLTALVGGIAAWWMGERFMVLPARALLEKARAIAGGDLAARVPLDGAHQSPEINRLGETFNQMAQAIETRQSELDRTLRDVEQEHALLDLVINNMSEGVVAADTQGRLLLFNAAARRLFRPPAGTAFTAESLGHELRDAEGMTLPTHDRPLARAVRGEHLDQWEARLVRDDLQDRVLSVGARPLLDLAGDVIGGLVVVTDVTERREAQEFEHGQEQVLELIATGVPLAEALEAVVRLVERRSGGALAAVALKQGGVLRLGAAVSLPQAFAEAIDGLAIADGASVCGTAAFRRQLVVVQDIATDPLTRPYRELAARHELAACWSMPVIGAWQEVLAVVALYHRTPREFDAASGALMEVATRLVRLAIERARAEEALRESEGRFRELAENIQDVFYSYDPRTRRMLYVSPAY